MSYKHKQTSQKLTGTCKNTLNGAAVYSVELHGGDPEFFKPFFHGLPVDQYLAAQGWHYRQRRYSRFRFDSDRLILLPQKSFTQSEEVNPLFANVPRSFEPLDPDLFELQAFNDLVHLFLNALPGLPTNYEIGVHQIRVLVNASLNIHSAAPVPEGRHKDGVDFIGIYVVSRENVKGAVNLLSQTRNGPPVHQTELKAGQLLVINDREYWHDTTPIESVNGQPAARDVFIFTAERLKREEEPFLHSR